MFDAGGSILIPSHSGAVLLLRFFSRSLHKDFIIRVAISYQSVVTKTYDA